MESTGSEIIDWRRDKGCTSPQPRCGFRANSPAPFRCRHLNVNCKLSRLISAHVIYCRHRHKDLRIRLVFLLGLVFLPCTFGQLALQPSDSTPGNPPTVFTQQPLSGSPEIQGNTKVLLCQAMGHPPPVYRWRKDGRFLSSTNTTETSYKIMNINRTNAGEYQCIATNNYGAILSNRVQVVVAYMIPFPSSGSMDRTVDQGQAHVINLPPIESVPEPSIHWFEFGSDRTNAIPQETQRYHITLRNQLVILESRSSDNNKMYQVRAQNSYTGQISDSQRYVFNVQNVGSPSSEIPPSIVIPPSNTVAVQGDDQSVTLECVANARSLNYLTINWYRITESERTLLQPDIKYILSLYRRRLTIKLPVTSDTGVYECEATFNRPGGPKFPTASATANLTVLVKPSFATPPPAELMKDYGSDVDIPCQAVGTPQPTVQWFYNTLPINDIGDTRMAISSTGRLSIKAVTPLDSGVFQCFVNNDAGEINAATWLRVVSSEPEIIQKPNNQTAIAGDSVRLSCVVTGAPKPDIVWYRVTSSGSEDLPGPSGRIQLLEKELLISVSDVLDSGRYVCNATNSKGNAFATAHVKVLIRTRITNPPQDASVIKGSNHMIQCKAVVDPSVIAIWAWWQNNLQIPTGESRRQILPDGSLLLKAVRNEDIGNYTCKVTSSAGNDQGSSNLRVIELPYPPTISVALNTASNRAVDVQWQPGFDGNSPIRKFIVQYRQDPLDWQVANGSVPPTARSYTVQGLQPARNYVFRVSAVNDVGEGQPSDVSRIIEMPQQPPSGPPRGVVGSPRSESSIIIQWQQPDEDKWNGPLKGYAVRYKPSGYPDSTLTYENITSHLVLMYELSGLIVFTEYEISVAAYNSKGTGVYSDTIQVRTQEGIPTQPPREIQGQSISSTSIRLEWLPPDPQYINGINQGYKVEATRVNTAEPEVEMTIPSNTSNMLGTQVSVIQHLRKFSQYSITILCFTSKGHGPKSEATTIKTLEDVPDQVESILFDDILDTSLQVMWTPPQSINGILTGYHLSYMKKGQTISKVTKELGPTTLNFTITGLSATTTYTIEVLATTRVGPGVPRTADIESGVPPDVNFTQPCGITGTCKLAHIVLKFNEAVRPEAPRNLAITNIQARSVLLQFVPGFSGYTSISKWAVEGQVNGEAEWVDIYDKFDPAATSLTVQNLKPYTTYTLRLIAVNVAGESDPSEPTRQFQTIQAPPTSPPPEVTVRAINQTAIRVRWKPLASDLWNGEGRGYMIQTKLSDAAVFVTTLRVDDENANSHTFTRLEEWMQYDFRVASFNKVGNSDYSPIATDRTRESVPSEGPSEINVTALSSTSVKVSFSEIDANAQNGLIRGYKIYSTPLDGTQVQSQYLQINRSDTREVTLTDLRKYTRYTIQVRGYTRIGDGQLSNPARVIRTFEDVPGPPSNVFFPEVTHTTCRVVWAAPKEPNGVLLGYRVAYRERSKPPSYTVVDDNLGPNTNEYYIANLQRTTFYVFDIVARTQLGWGEPATVDVYTVVNRRTPDPPSQPQVGSSQVGARWVTLNWQPGGDGYGPIRNFTLQMKTVEVEGKRRRRRQAEEDEGFQDVQEYISPNQTSHTVTDLKPNTHYQFRIAANNDLGRSSFSQASEVVITKQAPPDSPPLNLEVVPKTTTSVLVSWTPPSEASWNGNQLGYQVWYSQLSQVQQDSNNYQQVTVAYPTTSVELTNLIHDLYYEVKVNAFNNKGHGPFSRPYDVFVGEAVPTEAPRHFKAAAISATDISVSWDAPVVDSWNGDLLGYKIFYWVQDAAGGKQVKTVAATETQALLENLSMFTQYNLIMLAFNAAGDGPNTTVVIAARTHEGVPSEPSNLIIVMTSPDTVNISWAPPLRPNGIIMLYEISYYQVKDANGESLRVQVELPGDKHSYEVGGLDTGIMYVFSVKAKTSIDWGAPMYGNLTTGPQPGSPGKPGKPVLVSGESLVTITWTNSNEGNSPIIGYIIENKQKNGDTWNYLLKKNTAEPEALVSFNNLNPNTEYQFRVIAINSQGISEPSDPSEMLKTLELPDHISMIENKPFYQQWWFLVIVALTGLIFIIIVIAVLCMTGRQRRKKKTPSFPDAHIPKTTIRLDENGGVDEGGFSTFEMRRSQRAQSQRKPPKPSVLPPYTSNYSNTSRDGISETYLPEYPSTSNGHLPVRRKSHRSPPRPSPGSVNYSDEDAKTYADEESSSLTEKPSDISSSGSDSQESDSEPESEKEVPPPAFTNHYVNGDVQQSWQRNRTPSNVYAYTDSEHDSNYAVTLNGGHIIMNNMAGSRAPLPGFSSFV